MNPEPYGATWLAQAIDAGRALTGVSCPTAGLCVAVDEAGNVLSSPNPTGGDWTLASIDPGHRLEAVSCSSQSSCVAVDDAGNVLSSSNPQGGASAWRSQRVDFGELRAVSCSAAGVCVAVDGGGDALASSDPTAGAPTWSLTPIDGQPLTGVSCASSGLCVAVDGRGEALGSDDPTASIPSWSAAGIDTSALTGISCLPGGFCMALDTAGRSLSARVQPPAATTLTATEVTSASATLAGAVNPNDAQLGACSFEYGTTVAYAQAVACSALPTASGGIQSVSAQVAGLLPNTTYHYRVLASSPAGASAGLDQTFTTAVSSQVALVYPHPSVTGTPAPGQRLSCRPGTPAETSAQVSYAWLRDLIPIPGSTSSTYTVKYQDSGHHLQCQVTATDGGGSVVAKSSFLTVPAGGVPASTGETIVGRASFRHARVAVAIACSAHAIGGCTIVLRFTALETLSGGRIVSITARRMPNARRSATALRHVTVTLASARVHLTPGAHSTLSAGLSASGRRLLASGRRFTATLSVSGTVIGVIESQLSRQLVSFGPSARGASAHVAPHR